MTKQDTQEIIDKLRYVKDLAPLDREYYNFMQDLKKESKDG
jgi:hypothetical protein